jgi:hypothetical protein
MGEPVVSLNNSDHWNLLYNETINAPRLSGGYVPLAPFDLPLLAQSSLLLCYAENIDAKPWWYLGCRLHQQIETAISPGVASGRFAKVPINRPALLRFPLYAAQYSLRCEIPPWFEQMKISIWEYSGAVGDSTEQLVQDQTDLIRIDLIRIETKVDGL